MAVAASDASDPRDEGGEGEGEGVDHERRRTRPAGPPSLPLPQRLGRSRLRYGKIVDDEAEGENPAARSKSPSEPRSVASDNSRNRLCSGGGGADKVGAEEGHPSGVSEVCPTPATKARMGRVIVVLTLNSAVGGFLFGYDTGVVSGAMLQIKNAKQGLGDLTSLEQEVIVSSTIAGAVVGSLLSGEMQKRLLLGRRTTILAGSGLFAAGALVMGVAWDVASMTVGRIIVGIAVGIVSHVIPLYISECAPDNLRGRLTAVNSIFIVFGQVVAALVCCQVARARVEQGWRWMLGLGGVPALSMFLGFLQMPESPRYVLLKGLGDDASQRRAEEILRNLRGRSGADLVKQEMNAAMESLDRSSGPSTLWEVLRPVAVRRALLLGCFLQLLQQLCGVNTLMYYSATLLQMSGKGGLSCGAAVPDAPVEFDPVEGVAEICLSSVVACAQLVGTIAGMLMVDRFGRRPLLLASLAGVCTSLFLLGLSFHPGGLESASAPLVAMVLYLIAFGVGMAPLPWIVNAEIYPMEAKSTCVGIATAMNWVANFFVAATFLDLAEALSTDQTCPSAHPDGTFFLYALIAALGFVGLMAKMPETKGLSVEDVTRLFGNRKEVDRPTPVRSPT
mmetsp:Transcript_112340/g.324503  ORF Transcript_112340/g.324503 Transcript_112340/m.324503 type:complete len:619 (+) Transcript_112340:73-1929(+)